MSVLYSVAVRAGVASPPGAGNEQRAGRRCRLHGALFGSRRYAVVARVAPSPSGGIGDCKEKSACWGLAGACCHARTERVASYKLYDTHIIERQMIHKVSSGCPINTFYDLLSYSW